MGPRSISFTKFYHKSVKDKCYFTVIQVIENTNKESEQILFQVFSQLFINNPVK